MYVARINIFNMNQQIQAQGHPSSKLDKQAYLTNSKAIDALPHQHSPPPQQQSPPDNPQMQSVAYLEQASISLHNSAPALSSEQIYKEHREFLQSYKRERERERAARTSSHRHQQATHCRSASVAEQPTGPSKESEAIVKQKLADIQQRVSHELQSQRSAKDRPAFKLFAEVVENKNDIQRVSKERRFLRSQQSKHYEYNEPAMPARNKLPVGLRVRTEGIYDEVQLGRNARQFIERVQKEQERLLGKHLLRRKIQEGRRSQEDGDEDKRAAEDTGHKREERRLKAEAHLQVMKEKVKLSKLLHRLPDEERQSKNPKDFRYSLRGNKGEEVRQLPRVEERPRDKVTTDRLASLKETELNIKDRIAIRKHKVFRPSEYRQASEEELKENRVRQEQLSQAESQGMYGVGKGGSSCDEHEEESSLPSNKMQNEFISFTQYQEGERASKFNKD